MPAEDFGGAYLADNGDTDNGRRDNLTYFGQGIGWLFGGSFFLLCAWYLKTLPTTEFLGVDLYWEKAANTFFYALTGIFFLLSFVFFALAPRENPGMGRFLKSLIGGGEDGWRYAFLTAFAAGFAAAFYGISLLVPDNPAEFGDPAWVGWIAVVDWFFRILYLVAGFFSVVLLAFAIDSFFIKPMLNVASADQATFDSHVDRFKKRAIVVIPILITLVALIVELWR